MTALALTAVVVLAAAWLQDRRDKRHADERARLLEVAHTEREAMACRMHDERVAAANAQAQTTPDLTAFIALVENLCQRLQAPKAAITQHQMESAPLFAPPAVLPDDDEGYWQARGLTKEELADQVMKQELAERGTD